MSLRDWSLITGRGATKWEGGGGASEALPLKKGAENVITVMKGGGPQNVLRWF